MTGEGECMAAGEGEEDTLMWPHDSVASQLPELKNVYAALNKYQIVYQPAMSMYDR